jgi:hypothetical protein
MIPLQITAFLSSPLAIVDDYSPAIEGIIEYFVRQKEGKLHSTTSDASQDIPVELPLLKHSIGFYHASSPFYQYQQESTTRYRKRWDYQDRALDWGKKKAKTSSQTGQFKSCDLPIFYRNTSRVDWAVVGIESEIKQLLNQVTGIGKHRGKGFGQVYRWQISRLKTDYSLFNQQGQLMRPIPVAYWDSPIEAPIFELAWKLPSYRIDSRSFCYAPVDNAQLSHLSNVV